MPRLIAALFCLLSTLSIHAAPPTSLTAPRPVVMADFVGLNAQLHWFEPAQYQTQISQLNTLGIQWVRLGLQWDRVEPAPGEWRWDVLDPLMASLAAAGLKPLVYLVGSAPFASSAPAGVSNPDQYPPVNASLYASSLATLARRYPQVAAWQVWNEQNIPAYWQPYEDPVAYQALLEPSLSALSAANPNALRVMGGHAYYSQMPVRGGLMLEALSALGSVRSDRVSAYHPYSLEPEGDDVQAQDFIQRGTLLNQQLRLRGSGPIWATEVGWSSYAGPVEWQPVIGEQGQADYLLRRLALMSAMDYDKVFLFTLSDLDARATTRDRAYGLLRLDGSAKPAYTALQRLLQLYGARVEPLTPPAITNAPAGMISIAWRRSDGRTLWLFWAQEAGNVQWAGSGKATLHNPLNGSQQTLRAAGGYFSLPVTRELQVLVR